MNYNFFEVEEKIFKNHIHKNSFKLLKDNLRPKKYIIVLSKDDKTKMLADIYARLFRMQGYNVLFSLDNVSDDLFGLTFDFKREIDMEDFELQFNQLKENLLQKNAFFEEEKLKKRMLAYFEHLNIEPKKSEDFIYNNKMGYLIKVDFVNEIKSLEIFIENCCYVYGATYLKISCYLKEIDEFISEDEKEIFKEFLSSEEEYFFSGSYVINPFTQKEIPVFIFKKMKEDFLFGVPDIYETDYNFAYRNDVEIIKILKNGYLCNSEIVNNMNVQTANKVLYDEYYSKNCIRFLEKYNFEYVVKNSLKFEQKKLKHYFYYYYLPYLIHPYDEEKKQKDFKLFFKNSLIFVEETDNDAINYLLFLDILNNADNNFLIKNIVVNQKNDIIVGVDKHSKDVLRLRTLTKEKDINSLYQIIYDLWKVNYINIVDKAEEIERAFNYFIEDCLERYKQKNFDNFHIVLKNFLQVLLNIKKISYKQLKYLLIILNPIIPFITEEMYCILYNGNDTLCFENWPWEEE